MHRQESSLAALPMLFETLGILITILFFNTLRRVAIIMTNPYGDDEIDYELDYDLRGLWAESLDVVQSMSAPPEVDLTPGQHVEPPDERRDLADRVLAEAGVHLAP
ncbi:hypothetical protein OAO87_00280 [bacterium]|nr:hypothetical protein [bacterium]